MAVMTDVREAAQNLIEYAIHRSMIGQDDRIWRITPFSSASVLRARRSTWPGRSRSRNSRSCTPIPCQLDLEGTLAALAEAAVANGAAEDTASGRDRIAMRIMARSCRGLRL